MPDPIVKTLTSYSVTKRHTQNIGDGITWLLIRPVWYAVLSLFFCLTLSLLSPPLSRLVSLPLSLSLSLSLSVCAAYLTLIYQIPPCKMLEHYSPTLHLLMTVGQLVIMSSHYKIPSWRRYKDYSRCILGFTTTSSSSSSSSSFLLLLYKTCRGSPLSSFSFYSCIHLKPS